MEETDYDSVEETSSVLSTEEWEDESDSWETDNGLATEDDGHVHDGDAADAAASNPSPAPSSVFIVPPQEGSRATIASPTRGGSGENWEVPVASPSGGGARHHALSPPRRDAFGPPSGLLLTSFWPPSDLLLTSFCSL